MGKLRSFSVSNVLIKAIVVWTREGKIRVVPGGRFGIEMKKSWKILDWCWVKLTCWKSGFEENWHFGKVRVHFWNITLYSDEKEASGKNSFGLGSNETSDNANTIRRVTCKLRYEASIRQTCKFSVAPGLKKETYKNPQNSLEPTISLSAHPQITRKKSQLRTRKMYRRKRSLFPQKRGRKISRHYRLFTSACSH